MTKDIKQIQEWRKIETAPKDGTRVILYFAHKDICIGGSYEEIDESDFESGERKWKDWIVDDELFFEEPVNEPTHWMPLPKPPINN